MFLWKHGVKSLLPLSRSHRLSLQKSSRHSSKGCSLAPSCGMTLAWLRTLAQLGA